jgi:AmmeMemoRadiSam system protein B
MQGILASRLALAAALFGVFVILGKVTAGGPGAVRFPAAGGDDVRQPKDRVGFTHTSEGIARVVALAEKREAAELEAVRKRLGLNERTRLLAAVSPHDDYQYAQQVYVHVYPYLRARHVVLIGVAHRARNFPASEGKLVFDAFKAWHGPHANAPVSPLRDDLLGALAPGDVLVSNAMHAGEHSLEAMVPFLQHYNRGAAILPVLVPYMTWERLETLAGNLGKALAGILKARHLRLGEDVALLISSDSVHYGDRDWGGRDFADFGTTGAGYDRAVARDLGLIRDHLTGPIAPRRVEGFYRKVVADDCHEYRITWCGRFSVPFGLVALSALCKALGRPAPEGSLLRYGTTLDPGRCDPKVEGLGVTAPANLHHWVGFCSIAYR